MSKYLCAAVIVAFSVSALQADVIRGKIVKVGDKTITFQKIKSFDKEAKQATYEDAKEYPLATDAKAVKVIKQVRVKGQKKPKQQDVADGLSNTMFLNIDAAKGVRATIVTDDEGKVTEIRVGGIGGRKGKKKAG